MKSSIRAALPLAFWPLVLVAAAPVRGLAPDSLPSLFESAAESPALGDRLRHPWNQFLRDGQTSFSAGDLFYAEHRFSSPERFSLMPEFPILPAFPEKDSAFASVGGAIGREIKPKGAAYELPYNRIHEYPALGSFARARLGSIGRIAFEGEESNVLLSRLFPRRDGMLGTRQRSEAAYVGDALPPLSLWRAGGELERRGGSMRLGHARGFAWGTSLLTGESYPMETQATEMRVGVDEDLGMRFRYYAYDGISPNPYLAPKATLSEVGLALKGGSAPWSWKFNWGYRKRMVERGSTWVPFNRVSYPWAFRGGREWKGEEAFPWKVRLRGGLEYDESTMLTRVAAEAEKPLQRHVFSQGLRAYHRRPFFGDTAYIAEADVQPFGPPLYSAPSATYEMPDNGRGVALSLGYAWKDSLWEAGVSGSGAMEWEIPSFPGAGGPPVDPGRIDYSRRGVYGGSDDVLGRGRAAIHAEAKVGKCLRLRTEGGWQEIIGKNTGALEYAPAPYFGELDARISAPWGLRAEARLQGMGPKRYRGYGVSLRVPPHLESHLGLEHSFRRLRLRLTLFQVPGDEILEHPLGNPLRFRISGGMTAWI